MDNYLLSWIARQRQYCRVPKKGLERILSPELFSPKILPEDQRAFERIGRGEIDFVPWVSDRYPKILKEIPDPPLGLWVRGEWPDWESRLWVAVVGARKATPFGLRATRDITAELAREGIGIVSGLAYGIDAEAHREAVRCGGVTWGVLGSGLDRLYPRKHFSLAEHMLEKGGILSEFPLSEGPAAWNFPQRNRLISGLVQAVILVEGAVKSGSLITARFAMEQGREVFAVVPPAEHAAYAGTRKLLDEGAHPYSGVRDLIRETAALVPRRDRRVEKSAAAKKKEGGELEKLLRRPRTLDYLIQKTQRRADQILAELARLEGEGKIRRKTGAQWQSL